MLALVTALLSQSVYEECDGKTENGELLRAQWDGKGESSLEPSASLNRNNKFGIHDSDIRRVCGESIRMPWGYDRGASLKTTAGNSHEPFKA